MSKILRGAILIDGKGGPPVHESVVIVEGSKIIDVYSAREGYRAVEPDAEIYDLAGKYILPGLIDCHVHLCLDPKWERLPDMSQERDELLLLQAAKNAETSLQAGITTIRDCGATRDVTFTLRQAAARGLASAPRLVLCGQPLTITGGHAYSWGGEADGVEGVRQAVRQLVKQGADFVKIMATGGLGTPGTDPRYPSYTPEELRAIVEEAHRFGRRVAAHCHGTPGIANAVEAGVDSIEHASFLDENYKRTFDPDVANKIQCAGTCVVPILAGGHRNAQRLLETSAPLTEMRQQVLVQTERKFEIFRQMSQTGVKMAAGSDAGAPLTYFDDLIFELELMVEAGMAPLEALRLGTRAAAQLIGHEEDLGTIELGKEADILVVDGDPTTNIQTLHHVVMVIKAGEVVSQRRQMDPMPQVGCK